MNEYFLYPEDDKNVFFEICKKFENKYPMFSKEELYFDPLEGEFLQSYKYNGKHVTIILERLWLFEIIARSDIDLSEFAKECTTN